MSNQVYANMMEVSCKQASGKSICAFPDVCFTPPLTPVTPPGVPIPYPNTGMASDTTDGSSSVKISGQEVMLKNKSYFKKEFHQLLLQKARSQNIKCHLIPKHNWINGKKYIETFAFSQFPLLSKITKHINALRIYFYIFLIIIFIIFNFLKF